jgi:hypothetical protein
MEGTTVVVAVAAAADALERPLPGHCSSPNLLYHSYLELTLLAKPLGLLAGASAKNPPVRTESSMADEEKIVLRNVVP